VPPRILINDFLPECLRDGIAGQLPDLPPPLKPAEQSKGRLTPDALPAVAIGDEADGEDTSKHVGGPPHGNIRKDRGPPGDGKMAGRFSWRGQNRRGPEQAGR